MQLQARGIFRFHLIERSMHQKPDFGLVLRTLHHQIVTHVRGSRGFIKSYYMPQALTIEIAKAIIRRDAIDPGFMMIGRHFFSLFVYLQKGILSNIKSRLAIPHEAKQIPNNRLF